MTCAAGSSAQTSRLVLVQPSTTAPQQGAAGLQLSVWQQQAPADCLLQLLAAARWEAAFAFTQAHSLSADFVYRCAHPAWYRPLPWGCWIPACGLLPQICRVCQHTYPCEESIEAHMCHHAALLHGQFWEAGGNLDHRQESLLDCLHEGACPASSRGPKSCGNSSRSQAEGWPAGRAQWAAAPVTERSIAASLRKTADKVWVVEQALHRTAPTAEDQAALLEHGLAVSASHVQGAGLGQAGSLIRAECVPVWAHSVAVAGYCFCSKICSAFTPWLAAVTSI